ncbi:MAG: hypothetical protein KF836_13475 [Fimbriimonadaceae bacterium]|nr:hypothetical protein [Fimbriimonadaceae bacterium]
MPNPKPKPRPTNVQEMIERTKRFAVEKVFILAMIVMLSLWFWNAH